MTNQAQFVSVEDFTDTKMGERFADEVLSGNYRRTPGTGWHKWDGQRWKPMGSSGEDRVLNEAKKWVKARVRAVATQDASIVRAARAYLSNTNQKAMVKVAGREDGVLTEDDEFDADPDVLNTPDGILDLADGTVSPHDPDALITNITRGSYRPGAAHADWAKALSTLDDETRAYLRLRLGYMLFGRPALDDTAVFFHGKGGDGKTTVLYALRGSLGSYYHAAPSSALMSPDKGSSATPELVGMRGKRVVAIEELVSNEHSTTTLNTKRVKDLTADTITARGLYQGQTEYDTSHGLVITMNTFPGVRETDEGTWRRIEVVPFPSITTGDKDGTLRERLRDGGEGREDAVVTWLVQGAMDAETLRLSGDLVDTCGYSKVVPMPASVEAVTSEWRGASDTLARFVDECVERRKGGFISNDELYQSFRFFLAENGHHAWTKTKMRASLKARGLLAELGGVEGRDTAGSVRGWKGIVNRVTRDHRE